MSAGEIAVYARPIRVHLLCPRHHRGLRLALAQLRQDTEQLLIEVDNVPFRSPFFLHHELVRDVLAQLLEPLQTIFEVGILCRDLSEVERPVSKCHCAGFVG